MKILFLNHNYENVGTYFRCFFLGKSLANRGHDVTILCVSRKITLRIERRIIQKGLKIVYLPHFKYGERYFGHVFRMLLGCITLRERFDVVHGFCTALPVTAFPFLMHRLLRKSTIIISDWDETWTGSLVDSHTLIFKKLIAFLERYIPLYADGISITSDFLRRKGKHYGFSDEQMFYLPNGTRIKEINVLEKSTARSHLSIDGNIPILVSVGNTYMGNTFENLIKVFSLIVKKKPQARLFLVGHPGISQDKLPESLRGCFSNIDFVGMQPFEKVILFMASANVLILPMENSDNDKARFPIRFGDYLSSGRPIVSNAVGEVRRIMKEEKCGMCCDSSDFEGFAKMVLTVIEDRNLQAELQRNAIKAASKYSWDNITDGLIDDYEKVIKKH